MTRILLIILCHLVAGCSVQGAHEITGDTIQIALTDEVPNVERGKALFSQRGDAHCVLCHKHQNVDVEFQGDLGPDLSRLANRLTAAQMRFRIVDYDLVKPGTTMPSYYRTDNLTNVDPKFRGKTVLTALEIEDIIAFLAEDDNVTEN